jgi:hypothetical protein
MGADLLLGTGGAVIPPDHEIFTWSKVTASRICPAHVDRRSSDAACRRFHDYQRSDLLFSGPEGSYRRLPSSLRHRTGLIRPGLEPGSGAAGHLMLKLSERTTVEEQFETHYLGPGQSMLSVSGDPCKGACCHTRRSAAPVLPGGTLR